MKFGRILSLALLAVLAMSSLTLADAPRDGLVGGSVLGPDGTPLPGATVRLTGERGTETVMTDAQGRFQFHSVIPGTHTLQAELEGLQPAGGDVTVSAGGRYDLELVLQAAHTETLVVTAEVPLVDRYDTTSGGRLSQEALENVIGSSRIYKSWLAQLPGAIDDRESQRYGGFQPTIEGIEGTRQMYFVDGVDVSFSRWGGSTMLQVPATATQELKLEATGADVEYSRTVGAYVSVITKSGGNQRHGHFTYFPTNADWAAEQELFPAVAPDKVHSNWEASSSGPLVKDKLWYYAHVGDAYYPGAIVLGNGQDVVELSAINETFLGKLDWRGSRHSLTFNYMETPQEFPWWNEAVADFQGVAYFSPAGGDLKSLRWTWLMRDDLMLESHLATTAANRDTRPFLPFDIDPSCAPDQPCGNAWRYSPYDGDRLLHNGTILAEGFGPTDYPRDQGNVSLNAFRGRHDLKVGVDYQETDFRLAGVVPPFCQGFGYDPTAPGGFNVPVFCAFFPTKAAWEAGYGPVELDQNNAGLYLRDRMSAGRWSLNLGLRLDRQSHENDIGRKVLETTDFAPRFSVSYDVLNNGRLLLVSSAGRYILHLPQGWSLPFTVSPVGSSHLDVYLWDGDGYDNFLFHTGGVLEPQEVNPSRKDELTLGTDWLFHRNWALKARAVYWERSDYPDIQNQLAPTGGPLQVVTNTPGARAERQSLSLSVQRRFADGWSFLGAYTLSKTEGNCNFANDGGCGDLGDHVQFVNEDGIPFSRVNRWGPLATDRPHNFKVSGSYQLAVGESHTLDFTSYAFYQSGQPWNLVVPLQEPNTTQGVTHFIEPRGSRRNPDQYQVNFGLGWSFPLSKRVRAQLMSEIVNVTNEQELIGVIGRGIDGTPTPTSLNYQVPRFYRLEATLRF